MPRSHMALSPGMTKTFMSIDSIPMTVTSFIRSTRKNFFQMNLERDFETNL